VDSTLSPYHKNKVEVANAQYENGTGLITSVKSFIVHAPDGQRRKEEREREKKENKKNCIQLIIG